MQNAVEHLVCNGLDARAPPNPQGEALVPSDGISRRGLGSCMGSVSLRKRPRALPVPFRRVRTQRVLSKRPPTNQEVSPRQTLNLLAPRPRTWTSGPGTGSSRCLRLSSRSAVSVPAARAGDTASWYPKLVTAQLLGWGPSPRSPLPASLQQADAETEFDGQGLHQG